MINKELFILFGCGVALASLIGYAFWVKIRVVGLKADLAKILLDLHDLAGAMRHLDDPSLQRLEKRLLQAICQAEMISVPVMFYAFLKRSAHREELREEYGLASSDDPEFASVLRGAQKKFSSRIASYVARETFCGWLILLMVWAFPSLTKDEIERGASQLINPQEELQYA